MVASYQANPAASCTYNKSARWAREWQDRDEESGEELDHGF